MLSDSVSHKLVRALAMVLSVLGALVAGASVAYAADPPSPTPASGEPPTEEVVIEGKHEGPRMWRIAKGDHVMWVLGTISPLPRKMTWQADAVTTVLQETQEVLPAWPSIGVGANPFTALRLYFTWRKIQKSPDHMKLQEQLPPDLYARFSALKARYAPRDSKLEELRPMLAGGKLLDDVLDVSGLTMRNEVQQTVLKLASKQGVKVHQTRMKVDDPVNVLKDLGETPKQSEIACLAAIVSRLETDLGPMQARARAWALGDVNTLRSLPHSVDDRIACLAAVSNSARIRNLVVRAQDDWMIEAEDALTRNKSTLAVQSMDRLLGNDGILAALRAKGYTVEGP
jgi:uncharacterized protein YbaP (TraB family)